MKYGEEFIPGHWNYGTKYVFGTTAGSREKSRLVTDFG